MLIRSQGFKPQNGLAAELDGMNFISIGDALGAANILKAIADGYAAANNI